MSSPSPTLSSSILDSLLRLTKFAGQNKVPLLEWILAWTTVVVFGFRYMIDYAALRWKLYRLAKNVAKSSKQRKTKEDDDNDETTPMRLTTSLCDCIALCPLSHTRSELSVGIEERWERLYRGLFQTVSSIHDEDNDKQHAEETISEPWTRIAHRTKEWSDEDWIRIVHSNLNVRKEASYLMFALTGDRIKQQQQQKQPSPIPHLSSSRTATMVLRKLQRLWPKFLELPASVVGGMGESSGGHSNNRDDDTAAATTAAAAAAAVYDISLIVPMYRERITDIACTLNQALCKCRGDPKKVQVIIAHAESSPNNGTDTTTASCDDDDDHHDTTSCNSLLRNQLLQEQQRQQQNRTSAPVPKPPQEETKKTSSSSSSVPASMWGEFKVVTIPFGKGGGRGITLNIGAGQATAPILTFLHADTLLPLGWDEQIQGALGMPSSSSSHRNPPIRFPHACAFTMGIAQEEDPNHPGSTQTPPGLRGAEWLGVLRCHCGMVYGDSVLSFPRPLFDYMGGYPEQPLMEDYEVMDWLRRRSVFLSTVSKLSIVNNNNHTNVREGLVLFRDRALCSPRRWNKYGVAYTSLINLVCIKKYYGGATTEELFDFYYHCNSLNSKKGAIKVEK